MVSKKSTSSYVLILSVLGLFLKQYQNFTSSNSYIVLITIKLVSTLNLSTIGPYLLSL